MAVSTDLRYARLDELYLDPRNPRLGRHRISPETSQEDLLEEMRSWALDELAYSYLESGGFWTHEPLITVEEKLYGKDCLVVVEGNRRLAALKYLSRAMEGNEVAPKWKGILEDSSAAPPDLFERIPYVLASNRDDVRAFLGFRHVTGIKQWKADEKAAFIAELIDETGLSYKEVARKIGSKAPTVRKHYVAYKVLLQMENEVEEYEAERAHRRFTILYMSIDMIGVQEYLKIDIGKVRDSANGPVPRKHLDKLTHFVRWLFGTEEVPPIISDTRRVSDFGRILKSREAVDYLEQSKKPKFDFAFKIAGGDEEEVIRLVREAWENVELALMRAHAYSKSERLRKEVRRLGDDIMQLLNIFPDIKESLLDSNNDRTTD